jgi:uncharacterized protein YuzE
MRITYDKQVDALNVRVRTGRVAETLEVAPEMMVDVDKRGRVLSLEILGAKARVGRGNPAALRSFSRLISAS